MAKRLTHVSHITRKSGVFYYRRHIPGPERRQVAVSLRTCNYREAEHLAGVLDRTFALVIGHVRMTSPDAPPITIAQVVRDYLRTELAIHLAVDTTHRGSVPAAALPLGMIQENIEMIKLNLANRQAKSVSHVVDRQMAQHGLEERDRWALGHRCP